MIFVVSQRDIRHPRAGGAEKFVHTTLQQLAKREDVVHLSVEHPNLPAEERVDGIRYLRRGKNLITVIGHAFAFYIRNHKQIELVIDHSNTHQFFTFVWARSKRVFLIHQFTQEIWIDFYGRVMGRALWFAEEMLLRLSRGRAITVSHSTKNDLYRCGFTDVRICLSGNTPKYFTLPESKKTGHFVYAGRLVPYKRVEDAIRLAVAVGKKLYVIGRGQPEYEEWLRKFAQEMHADCEFMGFLPHDEKDDLIEHAEFLVMPSIREGWGLVITESGNLGTPSLVYDAPGTIEAVDQGRAGFVAQERSWEGLYKTYQSITAESYAKMRQAAFDFSLTLSWESTALVFDELIMQIQQEQAHTKRGERLWSKRV